MRSDVVIRAEGLTKSYRVFGQSSDRLKQAFTFGRRQYYKRFTALDDVSFEIRKGETVGIIGRNGSGKSTLLQMVCGILKPSSGRIEVRGRISALLELGAGFHPDFTGRENARFLATLLGLAPGQLEERLPAIESFADIGEYFEQPVRTYSSGMFVRLAFAVAAAVDPEVLVVDEALSVGDAQFQAKCFRRLEELKALGATIIFVSHALEQVVHLCDRALLLDRGRLVDDGRPTDVTRSYLERAFPPSASVAGSGAGAVGGAASPGASRDAAPAGEAFARRPAYARDERRWGDRGAAIVDFAVTAGGHRDVTGFRSSDTVIIELEVVFHRDCELPVYGIAFKAEGGLTLFNGNSRDLPGGGFTRRTAGERVVVRFSLQPRVTRNVYLISVGVAEIRDGQLVPLDRRYDAIRLECSDSGSGTGVVDMALEMSVSQANDRRLHA
jgi:lipopolysaccharide transport system ATP-binding protein